MPPKSVVLVRTGRMTKWPDFDGYLSNPPGIGLPAAKYLCEEAGAMCIAGDSIALEVLPSEEPDVFLPVHAYMFATAGAQIMEVVNMEEIAAEKQYEFAFLGFPLKLRGATGAPDALLRGAAPGLRLLEDVERKERGHERVGDVDGLRDPQVHGDGAEGVGRGALEAESRLQVVDHLEQRDARRRVDVHRHVQRDAGRGERAPRGSGRRLERRQPSSGLLLPRRRSGP